MREDDLVAHHPRLWHMAEDGSWPSIQAHGLLSTRALLDLYGVHGAQRAAILAERRPSSVALQAAGLPGAVVRDQKPMSDPRLRKCLDAGLAPSDWYGLLNGKTFFWLDRERLEKLLEARAYRASPHVVIEVDTAKLLAAHRARVMLCAINSGATLFTPPRRGMSTFLPIADYPYNPTKRGRAKGKPPVEFVVEHSVPDIAAHVVRVHRREAGSGAVTRLWP